MAVGLGISAVLYLATFAFAQQGAYKLWLEGISPCGVDSNPLVNVSTLKVSHYNRTSLEVKGAAVLHTTIGEEANMRMIIFKKNTNKRWVKTMVDTKNVNICKMMKEEKKIWSKLVDMSNLPSECPIPEGSYRFTKPDLELTNMPAILPIGCYRVEARGDSGQLKSCNNIYVKVTTPSGSPNPRCNS